MTPEIQRMKSLQSIFPRASQSFIEANPDVVGDLGNDLALGRGPTTKNESTGILKRKRGKMTGVEKEFGLILEAQKRSGQIRDYLFHPLRLPWGMNDGEAMYYSPDFMVTPNSGSEKRRMIEVKDEHIHYRQQAIARFKGCRADWPEFSFELHQKTKNGWKQIL
jgi:hypothetical protein